MSAFINAGVLAVIATLVLCTLLGATFRSYARISLMTMQVGAWLSVIACLSAYAESHAIGLSTHLQVILTAIAIVCGAVGVLNLMFGLAFYAYARNNRDDARDNKYNAVVDELPSGEQSLRLVVAPAKPWQPPKAEVVPTDWPTRSSPTWPRR